jgi:hypothetical protein
MSSEAIAAELGICRRYTNKALRQMHDAGQIYIARWGEVVHAVSGPLPAIYALGNCKDARKPKPLTKAQRNARYRSKCASVEKQLQRVTNLIVKNACKR